ncbi:hypothetical protein KSS87_006903 [Heliosperma pusillum]|nr:hypothetical protein KSS87_006903 [Heliosperma pusillum]
MSKTEDKKALVAQRLLMLQNDTDEDCNSLSPLTVTDVIPVQYDSTNPVKDPEGSLPCESDEIPTPSAPSSNGTKCRSNKRAMVVYDGDSKKDGKKQCLIQPIQEERITQFVEPPAEEKLTAMERAMKIQANLSAEYPSFVKMMIPSNVSGSFWMHPSKKFCNANLPKQDCTIVLVDEAGKEFNTKYLVHKTGLSAGWRGFSIKHALEKGDVLVYIVREDRENEVDGAVGLLELDTGAGQMISGDSTQKVLHTEDSPPMDSASPRNSDNDLRPEVLDGIRFSDSDIKFETIKDFNDFNITVDGLVIDSKFSHSNRKKYYELCLSQNSFLHQRLLKGMNCNLIIGIILETINIADAIKACGSSSTSIEDLQTWKTTLNGFELLGMKVGFLCDKLNQTLHNASELNQVDASNTSEICVHERGSASRSMNSMIALEDKLAELKGIMKMIDSEIEAEITTSVEKYKAKVKQIDNFPW